jgi:hypothetical protein
MTKQQVVEFCRSLKPSMEGVEMLDADELARVVAATLYETLSSTGKLVDLEGLLEGYVSQDPQCHLPFDYYLIAWAKTEWKAGNL